MILKKLAFKNFKSFSSDQKNQDLSNLDILTLIYGENNSGKSNVLKFIDLLFKSKIALDDSIVVSGLSVSKPGDESSFWKGKITNDAFLFHKNNRAKNISFETLISFKTTEISKLGNSEILKADLNLTKKSFDLNIRGSIKSLIDPYDSEINLELVTLNGVEIFSYRHGLPVYFQGVPKSVLFKDSVTFENLLGILNNCVLFLDHKRFLGSEIETDSSISLTPTSFKNWLHNLTLDPLQHDKYDRFIKFVKNNTISGNSGKVLTEFEATFARKEKEIEIFLKSNSERLPINSFGTGVMQILLILAMIHETNAKIILIEELELNLSPKSQQELIQILSKLISQGSIDQVIFTSHSEILSNTSSLSVYEVQLNNIGVSKIIQKAKPNPDFYKRKKSIDAQMRSVVRKNGVKGPEWY